MKKSALILLIALPFLLFSVKVLAEVCISQSVSQWQDYYCYWNHWLSDEGWGEEATDFSFADKVYCNVSAGMGAPEPLESPSFYELRLIVQLNILACTFNSAVSTYKNIHLKGFSSIFNYTKFFLS